MSWIATSIRNKVLSVFLLGITLVTLGAIYGIVASRAGLASVAKVNDTLVAQAIEAQALEAAFKEQVQQWMAVLVRGYDADAMENAWKQFTYREREVRRGAEKLQQSVEHPEARDTLARFLSSHAGMGEKYRQAYSVYVSSGFDAKQSDTAVKGIDAEPAVMIEDLVKLLREESQAALGDARQHATQGLTRSLGVIAGAILAAVVAFMACATLLVRTVVRPLGHAVKLVEAVAEGDLTVQVEMSSRDEMGRLLQGLRRMRDGLAQAVRQIRESAERVDSAAQEIATGNADLAGRTEQQASGLQQTASAMEQLSVTVRQNADSARQADVLASGASATAAKGGAVMADLGRTMEAVSNSSAKISDIIGMIDGIAFQTNILALNAAVEAARAGEQGRGFAVVASEVRALAQRSALAAKEIKGLVQNSVGGIAEGNRLVGAAGERMEEILASAQRVTEVMSAIKVATDEQLSGIEQAAGAVSHVDKAVQQNAAVVQQAAAAAQSMTEEAGHLIASVSHFKLAEDAQAGAALPSQGEAAASPGKATLEFSHRRALAHVPTVAG